MHRTNWHCMKMWKVAPLIWNTISYVCNKLYLWNFYCYVNIDLMIEVEKNIGCSSICITTTQSFHFIGMLNRFKLWSKGMVPTPTGKWENSSSQGNLHEILYILSIFTQKLKKLSNFRRYQFFWDLNFRQFLSLSEWLIVRSAPDYRGFSKWNPGSPSGWQET